MSKICSRNDFKPPRRPVTARTTDSHEYLARRAHFDRMLTIFGRKPVLEALRDPSVQITRLHLAISNRPVGIVSDIEKAARARDVETLHHSRETLSRISRNRRQDQGVAADVLVEGSGPHTEFISGKAGKPYELLALDGVTNPQNVGLIVRSVCASPLTGLLLPRRGSAPVDGLVIKASVGTIFRTPLLRCEDLASALGDFSAAGTRIVGVSTDANACNLAELPDAQRTVFVLGNETDGLTKEIRAVCDLTTRIPMAREVESLNVAMAATLIALRSVI